MAKKRVKKKQQQKKNIQIMQSAGIPKEKQKKLRNKTKVVEKLPQVKKYIRAQNRNEIARLRNGELKEAGFTAKEIQRMRYWGEDRYQKALLKKKKEKSKPKQKPKPRKERKQQSGLVLQLWWKDRTEFVDDSTLQNVKASGSTETIQSMINNINIARSYNEGEIGDYKIEVTSTPKLNDRYFRGEYYKQYEGTATRYKQFIIAVGAMIAGIYYAFEKEIFLYELAGALNEVNPKTAERFMNDLQLY